MKGQLTNTSLLHTLNIPFSVAYLGGAMRPCPPPPPSESPKTFFYEKKPIYFAQNAGNAVSETQISKTFRGGNAPGPPYNGVVTMASPSLKSWLRH